MNKFKTVTHVAAGILAALVAFALSPAGEALVKQYPKLSSVSMLIVAIGTLYHVPVNGNPPPVQ